MSALHVLVVDDSRVSRILSTTLLKSIQPEIEVMEAANGEQALEVLASCPPQLCIFDMNMPGMSGLELAGRVRALVPGVPIALLTANVQSAVQLRAEAQAVHFFRKPITEEVIRQILAVLGPELAA